MKVILQANVKNLGNKGELVDVAEGYARNYLVPRGLAVIASESNLKSLKAERSHAAAKAKREEEEARALAKTLEELTLTIPAKTGGSGRLFGSVTAGDIAEAAGKAAGIELDKRKVELDEPIKALGVYQVPVRLHKGIIATLKVSVVEAQGDEG